MIAAFKLNLVTCINIVLLLLLLLNNDIMKKIDFRTKFVLAHLGFEISMVDLVEI